MITTPQVVLDSQRARELLSIGAWNQILREAAVHASEQWIAISLPRRFDRSYAAGLGYATSQRRDPWHRKDPGRWPETYDEKKRQWQGHSDPLVWSGRMRAELYRNVRASATATKGNVTGRIHLGKLNVGNVRSGFKQLPAASMVRRVLQTLPPPERDAFIAQFTAYVATRLGAIGAPVKSAAKLPPPPAVLGEATQALAAGRLQEARRTDAIAGDYGARMRARVMARKGLHQAWSQVSGGSAPLGGRSRSPAERRIAHRAAARESYQRNSAAINARRRRVRSARGAIRRLVSRLTTHRPT